MEIKNIIQKEIEKFLNLLGIKSNLEINQKENFWLINIIPQEKKDSQFLIGRRGSNLNSLQLILRIILNKKLKEKCPSFVIDIASYRQQKEKILKELAKKSALKVIKTKKPLALDPMPASERKIIHLELAEMTGVVSESVGEDENRRVVIKPKNNNQ